MPVVIGAGGRVPPSERIDDDTAGSVEVPAQTTHDPAQDGIDFYESVEGMLVQVNNARAVGPINRFGEIWLVGDNGANASGANARGGVTLIDHGSYVDFNPERIMIDLSELTSTLPLVNVRDTTGQVTGAITYDFGNFRIFPTSLPMFTSGGLTRGTSTVATGRTGCASPPTTSRTSTPTTPTPATAAPTATLPTAASCAKRSRSWARSARPTSWASRSCRTTAAAPTTARWTRRSR